MGGYFNYFIRFLDNNPSFDTAMGAFDIAYRKDDGYLMTRM